MLLNFKMIESDKGNIIIDSELAIGAEISIEGEEWNAIPAQMVSISLIIKRLKLEMVKLKALKQLNLNNQKKLKQRKN